MREDAVGCCEEEADGFLECKGVSAGDSFAAGPERYRSPAASKSVFRPRVCMRL